ncbi:hypothetical protein Zmor_001026 [Zophobas morio]|uniref:Uncharacterized protein n=1 Tax=Zophobas morio TaxID=2755281 RepID=A0AA38J7N1_9CUCU|nr:hypothetical protein Zmor_001026 [Zophobas morio]
MLAVPVLLYSFGVVKWRVEELRKVDRDTRKMMHMQRGLHPRSFVPSLYFSRHRGGRELLRLECMRRRVVLGLALKILKSSDPVLRMVKSHENAGAGAFILVSALSWQPTCRPTT